MVKVDVCLCCAGVKISAEIELPSVPRVGDSLMVALQAATVRVVIWRLDVGEVMIHADLCEWNGRLCVPDKEQWTKFRKMFPVQKWNWQGGFPNSLLEICRQEMAK